jgi:hypothetical protein
MLSCIAHRATNRLRSDERAREHDQPGAGRSHRARRRRAGDDDQFTEPRAVTVNTSGQTADWYDEAHPPRRLN